MLLTANGRGVCISKYLLAARLPTRRQASLTGAIQRGARKARDFGEQTDRYKSRFNSNIDAASKRDDAGGARQDARSEEQSIRRPQAEPGQLHGRTDTRAEHEGHSRYSRQDTRRASKDRPRAERSSGLGGSRRASEQRTDSSRDTRQNSRYPRNVAEAFGRDHDLTEPFSRRREDQGGAGRFLKKDSFRGHEGDSGHQRRDKREVVRDRRLSDEFSQRERDYPSYPRKPFEEERYSLVGDRIQKRARYHENAIDEGSQESRSGPSSPQRKGHRDASIQTTSARQRFTHHEEERTQTRHVEQESMPIKRHVTVPLSIPRHSAASEFIYGTNAVKAALQAGTRKFYKLYVYQGVSGTEEREGDKAFFQLAQKRDVSVKRVGGDDLRLLDKMAQARPHNGYVLEASQLPSTPIEALEIVENRGNGFSFTPGHQSKEEVLVNGTSCEISGTSTRYPFVLMVDSILDPGNLGSIIRSAAYFGVDAMVLIDHNLAPFSSFTLKASSGAAEYMRYLRVKKDFDFVKRSKANGWRFFAAVAPESASASRGGLNAIRIKEAEEGLLEGPCVLMLGGEGDGIRPRLQKVADAMIGINGAGKYISKYGLDSLNVSVAAALMMQTFLQGSRSTADSSVSRAKTERTEDDEDLF